MSQPLAPRPKQLSSTGELLCMPYLDTDTRSDIPVVDQELRARGYSTGFISAARAVCRVGLWPQTFLWEEWHLDLSDVAAGYGLLFLILGIAAVIFGNFALPKVAVAGLVMTMVGVMLLGIAVVGWRLHRRKLKRLVEDHIQNGEL